MQYSLNNDKCMNDHSFEWVRNKICLNGIRGYIGVIKIGRKPGSENLTCGKLGITIGSPTRLYCVCRLGWQ